MCSVGCGCRDTENHDSCKQTLSNTWLHIQNGKGHKVCFQVSFLGKLFFVEETFLEYFQQVRTLRVLYAKYNL
jgi:hypothetical protein